MDIIEIEIIVNGALSDAKVWLENREILLDYDGASTWKSVAWVEITDGVLHIVFHGFGVEGTEWTITINELHPIPKEKIIYGIGAIQPPGHSFVMYFGNAKSM